MSLTLTLSLEEAIDAQVAVDGYIARLEKTCTEEELTCTSHRRCKELSDKLWDFVTEATKDCPKFDK